MCALYNESMMLPVPVCTTISSMPDFAEQSGSEVRQQLGNALSFLGRLAGYGYFRASWWLANQCGKKPKMYIAETQS
jgi:hypothetical protein